MSESLESGAFMLLWIGFLLLMILSIAAIFLWAVRARQFCHQERARYLALEAACADNYPAGPRGAEGRGGNGT